MEKLCVNPAVHNIQITYHSPYEALKHRINYKYMAIGADKHVKIMFDKMEWITQVSVIELYIKLELCVEVGVEDDDDDDDNDEDYVDETVINGEDFVDRNEYEVRIERGDFKRDIDDDEIEPNVHDDEIFDCGKTDADNVISIQNITNTIPTYTPPILSFSANT